MKAALLSALMGSTAAKLFIAKLKPEAGASVADVDFVSAEIKDQFEIGSDFVAIAVEAEDKEELEANEAVEVVVENTLFELLDSEEKQAEEADEDGAVPWHLDRLDQKTLPLDGEFDSYFFGGRFVSAYVFGTGIDLTHPEFQGRAKLGFNAVDDNDGDPHGSGTHQAGLIGSVSYGAADEANLVAVKVCTAAGCRLADILSGLSYVIEDINVPVFRRYNVGTGTFVTDGNQVLEDAFKAAFDNGFLYFAGAGDTNQDACGFSPGKLNTVLTVTASTREDARADNANVGRCVDVFGPGEDVISTWPGNQTAVRSGTASAAAVTAGSAAAYMGYNAPGIPWPPANIKERVIYSSAKSQISDPGRGTPNRLVSSVPSWPVPENPDPSP